MSIRPPPTRPMYQGSYSLSHIPNRTITTVSTVARNSPVDLGFHQFINGRFQRVTSDMIKQERPNPYRYVTSDQQERPKPYKNYNNKSQPAPRSAPKKLRLTAKEKKALARAKFLRENQEALQAKAKEKRLIRNAKAKEARAFKKAAGELKSQRAREARAAKKAAENAAKLLAMVAT